MPARRRCEEKLPKGPNHTGISPDSLDEIGPVAPVLPKLKDRGLSLLNYDECTLDEKATFDRWFLEEIEPLLTPVRPGLGCSVCALIQGVLLWSPSPKR